MILHTQSETNPRLKCQSDVMRRVIGSGTCFTLAIKLNVSKATLVEETHAHSAAILILPTMDLDTNHGFREIRHVLACLTEYDIAVYHEWGCHKDVIKK